MEEATPLREGLPLAEDAEDAGFAGSDGVVGAWIALPGRLSFREGVDDSGDAVLHQLFSKVQDVAQVPPVFR